MSENNPQPRIGILGGTFDPVHIGHLLIAEYAREQLGLAEIRFIPAAQSPLKTGQPPQASSKQRLEMLDLSIGGHPHFISDPRELKRGGTSYTVETLRELAQEEPEKELVFLIGADSLRDFASWHQPREICQLANIGIVARGGHPQPDLSILEPYLPDAPAQVLSPPLIRMPQIEISSSEIRRRVAAGQSIRYQVQPAVEAYVQSEHLYAN